MLEDLAISMPITQEARQIARTFASQQPTPDKAKQVYYNTLAVCMVNNYLRIIGIPTNITAGDCWNPAIRFAVDVADLEVLGLGRLECRPVVDSTNICYVPPEVQTNRIGYIVIHINDEQEEAILLGFVETVTASELRLEQLRSIDDLLEYLAELPSKTLINLSQWLEGIFAATWQGLDEVFKQPQLAFRHTGTGVTRSKWIDLKKQTVALIVTIIPEDSMTMAIAIEVCPLNEQSYLPANLLLRLLDEQGEKMMEAQAKRENKMIQFELSGEQGDRFSVKLVLGDVNVTEEFMV